ncbi:hypothetical protein GCM10010317_016150 [Streptomyces mirabilis]|nr:hypothetical protein GCM10010317_016150 [Streptomyces mirabilis]
MANAPAATSPDTNVAAARRAAPRLRADHAENEENTEFPFEQDPLTWGDGPASRIRSPVSYARHPKDVGAPRFPVLPSDNRSESESLSVGEPVSCAYRQINEDCPERICR